MATRPLTYAEFAEDYVNNMTYTEYNDRDYAHEEEIILREYTEYLNNFDPGFIDD